MKKNKPITQAAAFFNERTQQIIQSPDVQNKLNLELQESAKDFDQAFANDPQAAFLKIFQQILQTAFVSTLAGATSPLSQEDYINAGATHTHQIKFELTPQAGVSSNFRAFPILAEKFYANDDVLLNTPETKSTIDFWVLPDGSGFLGTQTNDESAARNRGLFSFAKSITDIKGGDQWANLSDMNQAFEKMTDEIRKKFAEEGVALEQKSVDQMLENLTIKTMQSLTSATQRSLPFDSMEESVLSITKNQRVGNTWAPGVSVHVDGKFCETPKDMFTLMGLTPTSELGALQRYEALSAANAKAESSTDFGLASGAINRWRGPKA